MLKMLLLLDTNDDLGDNMLPKLSLDDVESDLSKVKLFNEALEGDSKPEFNRCKSPPLPFDFFESVDWWILANFSNLFSSRLLSRYTLSIVFSRCFRKKAVFLRVAPWWSMYPFRPM